MNRTLILILFMIVLTFSGKPQSSIQQFDSIQFNTQLEFANQLVEYEFYTQQAIGKYKKLEDISVLEWFSYYENNSWHTVGGIVTDNKFNIIHHVKFDSLYNISDFAGTYDTSKMNTFGFALSGADSRFQKISDTINIFFNSYVVGNPDQTISIWYFPAFQPSGQAIYGCEMEYIYDKSGFNLLTQNLYNQKITGVWIGQPRELWINYLNSIHPTIGSIFFALSFRDYFTRIRINTQISTSTTTKNKTGNYIWNHSIK